MAAEPVEWAVINGTGSVSPTTSSTNADGIATSTWTFGPLVVQYRLAASVADVPPVEFASTPRAASAEYVRLSTDSVHLAAPGDILRVSVSAADSFHNAVLRAPLWASTDGTVAIVDEHGDVHAVGFGTAQVHASLDGLADTARVIVAPHGGAHATLAYIRPDGPYASRIIALDTVQDRRHTVNEKIGGQPFLLDWSPDGARLVFAGTSPAPHISVIDVPTRRVVRLAGIPQDALDGSGHTPRWRIAFSRSLRTAVTRRH